MDAFTLLNTTARLQHYEELARTMPARRLRKTLRESLRELAAKNAKVVPVALMPVQKIDG